MSVNINTETSNVVVDNSDRTIIINDNTRSTSINVNQPITNVISVNVPGPQGPVGPLNTGSFVQGGNSFGATGILGTNDNQSLGIETNGSIRMFVSSSGTVSIGTTSSLARFQVRGSGTTSASIALRVENGSGIPLFTILDNRSGSFNGNLTVNGSINNLPISGGINIAIGSASLPTINPGFSSNNIGIGNETLFRAGAFCDRNIAIGYRASRENTSGTDNIAIGYEALFNNQTVLENIAIGNYALRNLRATFVTRNMAIGHYALHFTTTGGGNIALGSYSLYSNTTGYGNIAVGALLNNTTGYGNIAVGALLNNTTGFANVSAGGMQGNTTGYYNTAIGANSLQDNVSGDNNTALGYNTGRGIETGRANTIIGANVTGLTSSLSNTIILADGDGNQKFIINSSSFATLSGSLNVTGVITGIFSGSFQAAAPTGSIQFNSDGAVSGSSLLVYDTSLGRVNIGTSMPITDNGIRLHVGHNRNGSSGILVTNVNTGSAAGAQLLMCNDAGFAAQWYAGSSNSVYGNNTLFLRQIANGEFRFVTDVANQTFYFGNDLSGGSPYARIGTSSSFSGNVGIGGGINSTGFGQKLRVIGQADAAIGIYRNQASAFSPKMEFMKSRGTYDSPLVVNINDELGSVGWFGYNGSSYSTSARIYSRAVTTGSGVEGELITTVHNNSGGNVNMMRTTINGIGIGSSLDYVPSARLQIRGSGATSSTTALRVENSTARLLLQTEDGGTTRIGGPTARLYVNVESGGQSSRFVVAGDSHFSAAGSGNAGAFYIDQGGVSGASRTIWYDESGGTKNLIQGNGASYITAGSVGIGKTTPNATLDVSGSAIITGSAQITGSLGVTGSGFILNPVSNTTGLNILSPQNSAGSLVLSTIGTPGINNGAYLILRHADGTFPNPTFTGTGRIISTQDSQYFNGTSYITSTKIVDISEGQKIFGVTPSFGGTLTYYGKLSNGNWYFGDLSSTIGTARDTSVSARVQIKGSGATSSTTALRVENSNATASLVVLDNGFVGIGISNPTQARLSVSGSINIVDGLINISGTAVNPYGVDYGYKQGLYVGLGGTNAAQSTILGNSVFPGSGPTTVRHTSGDVGSYIRLGIGSGITFHTNITSSLNVDIDETSNEVFRVTQTGNVGIGTASPGSKLDVRGVISITSAGDALTVNAGAFALQQSIGQTFYRGTNPNNSGGSSHNFTHLTSFAQTSGEFGFVRLNYSVNPTSGNVANNSLWVTPIINQTGGASGSIRGIYYNPTLTSLSGSHRAIETTSGDILFQSGSTPLLFVSGSGRVGIGTGAPLYSLDVNGTIRSQGQLIVVGQIQNPTIGVVDINGVLYSGTGVSIGVNSTNAARLLVRGSGATSSTTAFRVENSNTVPLLNIRDNGLTTISGSFELSGSRFDMFNNVAAYGGLTLNSNATSTMYVGAQSVFGQVKADVTNSSVFFGTYTGGAITRLGHSGSAGGATFINFSQNGANTGLHVTFNNGPDLMTVDRFGNVGIGNPVPTASLHISGASSAVLFEIDSPAVNNIIFVTGSGRIGIGTNTPNARLDVSGSAIISGSLTVTQTITGSIFTPISGTFVLPLTSSAEPNIPTGSAYWSGSFLFIWDGSQYRSSSFS